MSDNKPSLLVAKGNISRMGGAERDLIRSLPHLQEWYNVSVATLNPSQQLIKLCETKKIKIYTPIKPWSPPTSAFSQIFDGVHKSSKKAWTQCPELIDDITKFDLFQIISGDGYLAMMELIPKHKTAHLYLHEPHRGYHEDSLHRKLDGKYKRPLFLTNIILSKGRKNDLKIVRKFSKNKTFHISGNSNFSAQRSREVYGIECQVLHPCIDGEEYTFKNLNLTNPISGLLNNEYVVTIGTSNWAKGTMEVISMLSGTRISLIHIGGGKNDEISKLKHHASKHQVDLTIAEKLTSPQLCKVILDSLAVVSMAHKEPFGLTPIEAISIGTPAIFVDEGGFRDTIIDGYCGRLIPRENITEWHKAFDQARDIKIREKWAKNGRDRIKKLKLSPYNQAEKIHLILQS